MRLSKKLLALCSGALALSCVGEGGAPDAGCPGPAFDGGPLDPALVQTGANLVQQWQCQQCHGQTMEGNDDGITIAYSNLTQYPPNLTSDPATGLGCWTDAQIGDAILNGLDNQGSPVCGPMPHFSTLGLSPTDAAAIVAYLRSLPVYQNQPPQGGACACGSDSDCPPGQSCLDAGFCTCLSLGCAIPALADGGPALDGGPGDAGEDAGADGGRRPRRDGGAEDAGSRDGGGDAGALDAGVAEDAGVTDAGPEDAGPEDAGAADAGFDGGTADAGGGGGPADAGLPDAGPDAG